MFFSDKNVRCCHRMLRDIRRLRCTYPNWDGLNFSNTCLSAWAYPSAPADVVLLKNTDSSLKRMLRASSTVENQGCSLKGLRTRRSPSRTWRAHSFGLPRMQTTPIFGGRRMRSCSPLSGHAQSMTEFSVNRRFGWLSSVCNGLSKTSEYEYPCRYECPVTAVEVVDSDDRRRHRVRPSPKTRRDTEWYSQKVCRIVV